MWQFGCKPEQIKPTLRKIVKLINLTSHPIHFYNISDVVYEKYFVLIEDRKPRLTIEPSGLVARAEQRSTIVSYADVDNQRINIFANEYGDADLVPQESEGVMYIVSMLTAQAATLQRRDDIYVVNEPVQNSDGTIVGCLSLAII